MTEAVANARGWMFWPAILSTLMLSSGILAQSVGEQHLHTVDSPDGFAFGTRNTPDDAYRFCKGEAIESHAGGRRV